MTNNLSVLVATASFALAVGSNLAWVINAYTRNAVKKRDAERDFKHLENNQLQISSAIANGFDDIERRFILLDRDVIEIKSYMIKSQIKHD